MNGETLLLRQVHPGFIQEGRISSQVFRPTPKDESMLSAYNGDMIHPQPSFEHYTKTQHLASIGVVAVNKAECDAVSLPVVIDETPFPEHIYMDFRSFQKGQVEKIAKILREHASRRSWLYGPIVNNP